MSSVIKDSLFERALLRPFKESGANLLYAVSGFASPAMASYHLEALKKADGDGVHIKLIVGMGVRNGISKTERDGFLRLAEENPNIDARYVVRNSPVHSKMYAWYRDTSPIEGFSGSANYTQMAFLGNQREILSPISAENGKRYFDEILPDSVDIEDYRINDLLVLPQPPAEKIFEGDTPSSAAYADKVTISFLDKSGKLPLGASGLNWGQRDGREPNQAYIKIPADIIRKQFFPEKTLHFLVLTDDGKELICHTAQNSSVDPTLGKAIHTPQNNSFLGLYFRNRLGLANGQKVTIQDLLKYGRTDVTFSKIDDETYYMDFSQPSS